MGYKEHTRKESSRIWCSPIFHWGQQDSERYMRENNLPRNPVKDAICISGECLCGAFAGKEEWAEIKAVFPEAAAEINRLHQIAIENGHPWPWASGPIEYYKNNPPSQPICSCAWVASVKIKQMSSVYQINKGVNASITFKGLKAQYIWYLGGGIVGILIAFAIMYICSVNMFVCLAIALITGGVLFSRIYSMSNKYGEHGMLKKIGKRQIPKLIRNNSRRVFMK